MAFTFEEFPNSDYYNSDLRQVLKYMREFEKYIKTLDGVIEELRAGIERLDGIESDVSQLQTDYSILRSEVDTIHNNVSDIVSRLDSHDVDIEELQHRVAIIDIQLEAVYQYVDDTYAELFAKYTEDFNMLQYKINLIKVTLQQQIDALKERLDTIDTSVYNSWLNRRVGPQENQDFTYNHLADECLTAEQYNSLGYTASEYSYLGITSRDYQEFGKHRTRFDWVYSPVYGWRQAISNVLTSIVNYLKGTMSADEYIALDLDADAYVALDLTSEDYFGYNPSAQRGTLGLSPTGQGLTSEQYSHITIQ